MNRKICVITDSRAEYGHLQWLCHDIAAAPELDLQIVATGAHLSPYHGLTCEAIEADGFRVDWKVDNLLAGDGPVAVAKSMGLCVQGMADALDHLRPDVVVLLGDRYEMLAAASAAMIAAIPIAHIHGGELTEGAMDESIRHAITKMAHLHFCAAAPYCRRIIQMGEDPARVFNVGAPGLDHLARTPPLSRDELEDALGLTLSAPVFLVTYHPVTLKPGDQTQPVRELLTALEAFPEATVVITGVNADTHRSAVAETFAAWAAARPQRARVVPSLGQQRYLSMMRIADAVVGNSSSGIIEAPAVKTPTVNIGPRQKGRLRADSVIDAGETAADIRAALRKALSPAFQRVVANSRSLYGAGDASRRIVEVLRSIDLHGLRMKAFHDLPRESSGSDAVCEAR